MQFIIKINELKITDELEESWSDADFKELLKRFDYPDADAVKENEVKDFLFRAINDFEPAEAAAIVLDYKLSDELNEGQINNLSNEMLREKMAEKYTDIYLHKPLFEINQLLYKAYNGKFPHMQVNVIDFSIKAKNNDNDVEITKEVVLKALSHGFSENNLIKRLFGDQLEGSVAFPESEGIVWDLIHKEDDRYLMITSEKWITNDEITQREFEGTVTFFEESEDE